DSGPSAGSALFYDKATHPIIHAHGVLGYPARRFWLKQLQSITKVKPNTSMIHRTIKISKLLPGKMHDLLAV
ncbi:hypothetical protein E4U52_000430, partial [Claviceps spartinae]